MKHQMHFVFFFVFLVFVFFVSASFSVAMAGSMPGGVYSVVGENSVEMEELAQFAVDQHVATQNSGLKYVRLVSARKQVVSGIMHYLTLEVELPTGEKQHYEAKIWEKAWENFKNLESFTPVQPSSITSADLGVKRDAPPGLGHVSVEDPSVKEAAENALLLLQESSNSLVPYELKGILTAHAEVTDDLTKFHLALKLGRGSHDEECAVVVHRSVSGHWILAR